MKKVKLVSMELTIGRYSHFVNTILQLSSQKKGYYTCVANVHMFVEAYKSKSFSEVVNNAAIVTPDGKPLCWALKILHGIKQERVAGMDLLPDLLREAASAKTPVYFYGGQASLLEKTRLYLQKNYPDLIVAGSYSPPFRMLSLDEEDDIANAINNSGAELVFVVLGCPKQEKWMAKMQGRINSMMIGVGGALPVMIGIQKRAPRWMQKYGLEWFYRLLQEPGRLLKRYAVTNTIFLYLLTKAFLSKKLSKGSSGQKK